MSGIAGFYYTSHTCHLLVQLQRASGAVCGILTVRVDSSGAVCGTLAVRLILR
ncbi:predicted protein [Sclerotinia sclerotiorum 1980 UF-70]|uniref:Uncharacterized protein n=1 Tax=Sclerotinia sclerotiorum (strain ATCC 18683 / 1980 / Ss-1) TaxID=665079 RepID=A7F0A9_SCLS1|nr:predicted protein [Sclerotinia sclerotiorum 1980 UF-70]EDN95151.1 predicted protein [Sclerotinia sclerotiorum 1980 UF-70]